MKKLIAILFLILFTNFLWAGDNYFQGTVTIYEGYSYVAYKWVTPAVMTDSTGSYHSPPLYIGDCNDEDGYVSADASDGLVTEDKKFYYHFSSDLATWTTVTVADLDQLITTQINDTIGIEIGVNNIPFHNSLWLVIECDGQTGNPDDSYAWIVLHLKKDFDAIRADGQFVEVGTYRRSVQGVTNP